MELIELSIAKAADLLTNGDISPLDLVKAYINRIEMFEPKINAFITKTFDMALAQAKKSEQRLIEGESRGRLEGIPIALKDIYEMEGIGMTAGSSFLKEYVSTEDAYVVAKLRDAGAVFLGKLNMHEIALGTTNENPHYGDCHNPWAITRMTGGSSGGSGAAVAARMCLGSLGTDTGGSIRIPASLCGIVGFKPTYGRVSKRGVMALSWNLDHVGPMARTVLDAAVLYDAIAGFDSYDPYSKVQEFTPVSKNLEIDVRGLRIALGAGSFFVSANPIVQQAVTRAAHQFEQLGAIVEEVELPWIPGAARANSVMTVSDAVAFHYERLSNAPELFGEDILRRLQAGGKYTSTAYIQSRRVQTLAKHQAAGFFETYDLLLTPTTPIPAPRLQEQDAVEQAARFTKFTSPFNLTGLPALSVPCGLTVNQLPIGLQIVGPWWREDLVLAAGYVYEKGRGLFPAPLLS